MQTRVREIRSPFSCRWCGNERWHHGWTYTLGQGYHQFEPPTEAQILARMNARHDARQEPTDDQR